MRLQAPRLAFVGPVSRWWARLTRVSQASVGVAALLVAVLVPAVLSPYWESVLFFPVGIYVLLALGLNVVVGQAGLLDVGYVAFYAVGAYTAAELTTGAGLTAWEVLPLAVVLAVASGLLVGTPTLRLRGDYLAIVTLGFGEIARIVAQNSPGLGGPRGITGIPHPGSVLGATFGLEPLPYYYLTLAAIVLTVLIGLRLNRSRVGRSWIAIREDEDAAEATGVPTFKMKVWAFVIGAGIGGLAGWIYASKVSFINPENFPFFLSVVILSAVVLGGMGSIAGVIAGAFVIGFLPEYLRDAPAGETLTRWLNTLIGGDASNITEYRVLLFGLALVLMMIFRPQGLLPSRRRAAELAEVGRDTPMAPLGEVIEAGAEAVAVTGDGDGQPIQPVESAPAADEHVAGRDEVVLEVRGLRMEFGGVTALDDVNLEVRRGEILAIIGPNGAGKTTIFNCITGVIRPTRGTIRLEGRDIVGRSRHRVTTAGIARTFQNIRLFPDMTALENVMVGVDARHRTGVPGALVGVPRHWHEERDSRDEAHRLLERVGLSRRAGDLAANLSYGDQRRLEIARALGTRPKVLLLDEPAAGMSFAEKGRLMELIRSIRTSGVTIVLIEHDMNLVMDISDRVVVLDFGETIAEGPPEHVQQDGRVIAAYLGTASALDAPGE